MIRIGQGFDIHRLVPDQPLKLGGVLIDSALGTLAHSDGDVLLHALIDALLGAAALGDIGDHFPPTDPQYRNADSAVLLTHVLGLLADQGWQIVNLDSTIFLEYPKLQAYKDPIRQRLTGLLGLPLESVSVKAKTMEKLGAVGTSEAIAASVSVLIQDQTADQDALD